MCVSSLTFVLEGCGWLQKLREYRRSFGGVVDCSGTLPVVAYGEDSADMSFLRYDGRRWWMGHAGRYRDRFDPCKNQDVLTVFYLCTRVNLSLVLEECDWNCGSYLFYSILHPRLSISPLYEVLSIRKQMLAKYSAKNPHSSERPHHFSIPVLGSHSTGQYTKPRFYLQTSFHSTPRIP